MIVHGTKIAQEIADELRQQISLLPHRPVLSVVMVGDDPVIAKFVGIKKRFADQIGVIVEEHHFSADIDTDTLVNKIEDLGMDESVHGIVVQLPLPPDVDTTAVLSAIPPSKDVDVLSHSARAAFNADVSAILPPVVGAIRKLLEHLGAADVAGKHVVIVGQGQLVGQPAGVWFERGGAHVVRLARRNTDLETSVRDADILVLGAGSPGLITPDMVHADMIVLDAGTSEAGGKLAGDADPRCADHVGAFTPVPGGIGPVTVAMLFANLVTLTG